MRSLKQTTAAVLRSIIGIKDLAMAELVGCSVDTIRSLESGRLKLSEEMAKRLSHQTGVRMDWLLAGDRDAPALTFVGEPYTVKSFERHRAKKTSGNLSIDALMVPTFVVLCSAKLRAIGEAAHAGVDGRSGGDFQLFRYKLDRILDELAKDFGVMKAIDDMAPEDVVLSTLKHSDEAGKALHGLARTVLSNWRKPSKQSSPRRKRKV